MEILDIESWEIPYCSPLDDQEIQRYAKMDSWSLREAVMLSLGYLPARRGDRQPESVAKDVGLKVRDRWDLVNRAMLSGKLEYTTRPYRLGKETPEYCFEPAKFLTWLKAMKLEGHEDLFAQILGKRPKAPQAALSPLPTMDNEKKELSQKERGSRKGLIMRDFMARIEAYAYKQLTEGKTYKSHIEHADILLSLKKQDLTELFPDPRPAGKLQPPLRGFVIKGTKLAWQRKGLGIAGTAGVSRTGGGTASSQ